MPPVEPYPQILAEWIIEWDRFLADGSNKAQLIAPRLIKPLARLRDKDGKQLPLGLAELDLLRGYLLRLPTGQAVAEHLNEKDPNCPVMTRDQILAVASDAQKQVLLDEKTNLAERTPLWFYIVAEAAHFKQGQSLGPVGSRIVSWVLIELVRNNKDSYLHEQNWSPDPEFCQSSGKFELADLLRLAKHLA
jgi:hypothetical protein